MLAKYWKKIGLMILIIACIFNVMDKLITKIPFNDELEASATYSAAYMEEENENIAK